MKFLLIVSDNPSGGLSAIKSISGEGDVLVSAALGTEKLNGSLKKCLDSGASEAYRIMDGDFLGSDTWAVSRIYAAFVEEFASDADLIIFDGYSSAGPSLAHLIQAQQFCYVTEIKRKDGRISAVQDYGDEKRECAVPKKSVLALVKNDTEPNVSAEDGRIKVLSRCDIGLAEYSVGAKGSKITVSEEI